MNNLEISIITPTFCRAQEIKGLLENIPLQTFLPTEIVIVDGLIDGPSETEVVVANLKESLPFSVNYIREGGGTAVQRNVGIEAAKGDFIAFIDDDVRLHRDFFLRIMDVFDINCNGELGAV